MRARFLFSLTLVAAVLLCFSSTLEAQRGQGGQGRQGRGAQRGFGQQRVSRTALVKVEAVQKELDVDDDQKAQIDELPGAGRGRRGAGGGGDAQGGGRRGGGGGGDAQGGGQRGGQRGGGRAQRGGQRRGQSLEQVQEEIDRIAAILMEPQMKRLNEIFVQASGVGVLSDPVIAKELEVTEDQTAEVREIQTGMFGQMRELFQDDPETAREKMVELQEETNEKCMDVLSDDQKKKLADMKGKEFELPEGALRGGRGRGRGGNRTDF